MRSFHMLAAALCLEFANGALAVGQIGLETAPLGSPDGQLQFTFRLDEAGRATGRVNRDGDEVAVLAFGLEFAGQAPLRDDLRVTDARRSTTDETYSIPVGKTAAARDHHNELVLVLEERHDPARQFELAIRAFDDGLAFRYQLPQQRSLAAFELDQELTALTFPKATAHFLPLAGFATSYEAYYQTRPVAEIDPQALIGLPLLLNRTDTHRPLWVAVTEANLSNYAGMYLAPLPGFPGTLGSRLSPIPQRNDGRKVSGRLPHDSPWRVLMVGDDPGRLIESNLVFNLSDPSRIADPAWIRPGRTTFPWWNGYVLEGVDFEPGLNTATMKHYIDFCAENGIEYHSLDGTDTAWYGGPIAPEGPTDITTSVPEIDLPDVLRHAREKGVRLRLWMHWRALQAQLDEALPVYEKWGIEGIMVDFMDRDDQEMVAWYHEVAEKCSQHHLTVTWHGAFKPVGMERTWPNVLTTEAVLNQEYNKWDEVGTPPEHNLNVAFIRTLAGPLDYHQGGMRTVLPESHQPRFAAPTVPGTRGQQLAMYVVYENHLPMLADSPSAYRGQAGFDFLTRVPCNWDETRVLNAEFGKCLVLARRKGAVWSVGGMTADRAVSLDLQTDFLQSGLFQAEVLEDDPGRGPTSLVKRDLMLAAGDPLRVTMPRGGGFVATLRPAP